MGTKSILLGGYTGYCLIDGKHVLMPSYNISVSTNVIKSQAAMPFFVKRMAGYALRDYPVYSLSITIEPNEEIFDYLLNKLFMYRQGFGVKLVINDNTYSLTHTFSYAYLTGLDCEVSNEAACIMSLTFVYFGASWQTKFSGQKMLLYNIYPDSPRPSSIRKGWEKNVGAVLMPYYFFGVIYSGYPYHTLYEFSFSFNQDITPKFFCYGAMSSQVNAAPPGAVVWGLPTLTYNLTYVMAKTNVDVNDYLINSHKIVRQKNDLDLTLEEDREEEVPASIEIWYHGKKKFTFWKCYPDSYGPSLVNKGAEANKYNITGSVYGTVTIGEDEEEPHVEYGSSDSSESSESSDSSKSSDSSESSEQNYEVFETDVPLEPTRNES